MSAFGRKAFQLQLLGRAGLHLQPVQRHVGKAQFLPFILVAVPAIKAVERNLGTVVCQADVFQPHLVEAERDGVFFHLFLLVQLILRKHVEHKLEIVAVDGVAVQHGVAALEEALRYVYVACRVHLHQLLDVRLQRQLLYEQHFFLLPVLYVHPVQVYGAFQRIYADAVYGHPRLKFFRQQFGAVLQ